MSAPYRSPKVCTIVPVPHLGAIEDHSRFLALTHLIGLPGYADFYRDRISEGKHVILDNSTVELGAPEALEPYFTKAREWGFHELVAPDYLFDCERTLWELEEFMEYHDDFGSNASIMAVPQGSNPQEWLGCATNMVSMGVDTIGISRRYLEMFGGSRFFACKVLEPLIAHTQVQIHLLGAGNPVYDVAPCLELPYVRSVDSALVTFYTTYHEVMSPIHCDRLPNAEINLEYGEVSPDLLARNITMWHQLCGGQR